MSFMMEKMSKMEGNNTENIKIKEITMKNSINVNLNEMTIVELVKWNNAVIKSAKNSGYKVYENVLTTASGFDGVYKQCERLLKFICNILLIEKETENMNDEDFQDYFISDIDNCIKKSNKLTKYKKNNNGWIDEEVAQRRKMRNKVKVIFEGKEQIFKSVAVAFKELNLPLQKHVKFRSALKKIGNKNFEFEGVTYAFVVIK